VARTTDDTLRIGSTQSFQRVGDPTSDYFAASWVNAQIYETPLRSTLDRRELEPSLLLGRPMQLAPTTWRGVLRAELRTGDGIPVDAAEVAANLAVSPAFRGIDVRHHHDALEFHTARPEASFEQRLCRPSAALALRRAGALAGHVGTGPYRLVEVDEQQVVLERVPGHPSAASVRRVELRCFPRDSHGEATALIEALRSREVDLTCDLTRDEVERVQSVRRIFRPGNSTAFLAMNVHGALGDPAIRRFAAMHVDRLELTGLCHQNPVAYVARGLLPPQLGRVAEAPPALSSEAREDAARRLRGMRLRLLVVWAPRPYLSQPIAVAQRVAAQFAGLGVEVVIEQPSDVDAYLARLERGDYDLVVGGWMADSSDPGDFFRALLARDAIPDVAHAAKSCCNVARAEDAALESSLAALNDDLSLEALARVQARADELTLYVPIMFGASVAVHGWRVLEFPWDRYLLPPFDLVRLDDA
jgi:ABC-type oligopeptide transport system substrate-binding subunit